MGSLEKGDWDAFLPYSSNSNFSGDPYHPLQADDSFEQNGFVQKGVLRGMPLGHVFDQSLQKHFFPDPRRIHFKPFTVLNKTVWSKRGGSGGGPWDTFLANCSKNNFFRTPVESTLSRLQF